jgi:hypothetical protein
MAFYKDETSGTIQVGAFKGASSDDLYRLCIPMMVLTTLSVALRVYVRGYLTRTFGVEDWLIIPAYVRNSFLHCQTQTLLTSIGLVHGNMYKWNHCGFLDVA